MKKNIIHNQMNRVHKDIVLLSIAIFAIVGSIIVFRSYAQSIISTQKEGVVSISTLNSRIENSTLVVKIRTGTDLKYCLPELNEVSSNIPYIKYNDSTTATLEYDANSRIFCHKARSNESASLYMDMRYISSTIIIY